jgi:hypothetical protein
VLATTGHALFRLLGLSSIDSSMISPGTIALVDPGNPTNRTFLCFFSFRLALLVLCDGEVNFGLRLLLLRCLEGSFFDEALPEGKRFLWVTLVGAGLLGGAFVAGSVLAVCSGLGGSLGGSLGDAPVEETLSNDRLLLRRRVATCVMRGFPVCAYRDGEGGN